MKNYSDICVIFGGVSSENEISVITGTMVCNVLEKGGKTVLPVYIEQSGKIITSPRLKEVGVFAAGEPKGDEVAFARGGALILNGRGRAKRRVSFGAIVNCCHGGDCEGGAVAGLAAIVGVPIASAGMFESAAFMDKYLTKLVLSGLGVGVAPYIYAAERGEALASAATLGYPVIVKPCRLGSSIGIARAADEAELAAALDTAFELDSAVIIEKYLSPRREINCAACYDGEKVITSPPEEVFTDGDLLSYSDKYSGGGRRAFPADIPADAEKFIENSTARVYSALNMRGIVRFDYIMSGGEIYISEINTVPGSLSQYLLSEGYSGFARLLEKVVAAAAADYAEKASKRIIRTGILNNLPSNACKIK